MKIRIKVKFRKMIPVTRDMFKDGEIVIATLMESEDIDRKLAGWGVASTYMRSQYEAYMLADIEGKKDYVNVMPMGNGPILPITYFLPCEVFETERGDSYESKD